MGLRIRGAARNKIAFNTEGKEIAGNPERGRD